LRPLRRRGRSRPRLPDIFLGESIASSSSWTSRLCNPLLSHFRTWRPSAKNWGLPVIPAIPLWRCAAKVNEWQEVVRDDLGDHCGEGQGSAARETARGARFSGVPPYAHLQKETVA